MSKHICHECGTENEEMYIYCKNCGVLLSTEREGGEQANTNSQYTAAPSPNLFDYGNVNSNYNGFVTETIDGIPLEEVTLFVGKKASDICPKFTRMEITNSKTSWCWPVAVLSFFFGPFGAALWFFYRKMYRHATVLSVIGAIIAVVTTVLSIFTSTLEVQSFITLDGSFNTQELLEFLQSPNFFLSVIAFVIGSLADIVTAIVCGLYAFYWYKKHCSSKILTFRSYQGGHPYYKFGIASIGGVSGAMLTLGIVIMISVNYLTDFISLILSKIF